MSVEAARLGGWARTAEAALNLTVAQALRQVVPMPRWARLLGPRTAAPPAVPATPPLTRRDRRLAEALRRADRRLPWSSTCLDRAVAGQLMLRRQGRLGTVVIGLDRSDPGGIPHAWLVADGSVLVGGEVAGGYVPTTTFGVPLGG